MGDRLHRLDRRLRQDAVAEVHHVPACRPGRVRPLGEQDVHLALDPGDRGEQGGGVEVALEHRPRAGLREPGAHLRERLAPVDRQHVDRQLGEAGEQMGAAVEVIDQRHPGAGLAHGAEDPQHRRLGDRPPARQVEQAAPGVEQLERLGAGAHLAAQVRDGGPGEPVEQLREPRRIGPAPAEEVAEALRRPALDQVGRERPGGAREADQRHPGRRVVGRDGQRPPHRADGVEHVPQGLLDPGVPLVAEGPQGADPGAVAHRGGEDRPVAGREHQLGAHGFERQQDVGEQDGGVHAHQVDRLDGHLGRQLRGLAEGEEVHVLPHRPVLRQIAPGLAHHPHRPPLGRLAPAGAQEQVVHGQGGYQGFERALPAMPGRGARFSGRARGARRSRGWGLGRGGRPRSPARLPTGGQP